MRYEIGQKERRSWFFKTAAGICILSARKQPARQRFFLSPSGGAGCRCVLDKKTDNHKGSDLVCYRLCVCASGSLITDIFSCRAEINVSCLHLGQYNGKFSRTVSSRIFNRVLQPQTGHKTHCSRFILPPLNKTLRLLYSRKRPNRPYRIYLCNLKNVHR